MNNVSADSNQHRALINRAVDKLQMEGFEQIHSVVEGKNEYPKPVTSQRTGQNYKPDITAFRNGKKHIMLTSDTDMVGDPASVETMKILALHADKNGLVFWLAVPRGVAGKAGKILVETGIFANIIEI